jgi:hypothetical protein
MDIGAHTAITAFIALNVHPLIRRLFQGNFVSFGGALAVTGQRYHESIDPEISMNWWTSLLLAGSIAAGWAGDIDSASLLTRVQSKVRDNARRIPRYVCQQKIERQSFAPLDRKPLQACVQESEQGLTKRPGLSLVVADRAQLDVMLTEEKELFSWPGGRSFDTDTPADLLGGGFCGSGDFASFVINVFTLDQVTF